jgi:hypothetical protein
MEQLGADGILMFRYGQMCSSALLGEVADFADLQDCITNNK